MHSANVLANDNRMEVQANGCNYARHFNCSGGLLCNEAVKDIIGLIAIRLQKEEGKYRNTNTMAHSVSDDSAIAQT